MKSYLLSSFILITVEGQLHKFRDVHTREGPVRGLLNFTLLDQSPYYSFRGVPYATPPIGDLRFKPPKPIDSERSEIFNAFDYGDGCPQITPEYDYESHNEDCLSLNVFVPVVRRDEKLAVMFHLFGGGFIEGEGDNIHTGEDFLVERGIILVTYNVRVGMLGFMSLGTPEYSGNMGLKDQRLALKWTYDNIEHFGGDNKRITISGHSSGSIMTSLVMLNDESWPYIHQAFLMSGTGNVYTVYLNGDHRCLIDIFAEQMLGSSYDYSMSNLTEFLRTVSVDDILAFQPSTTVSEGGYIWLPVIENRDAIYPIITDTPLNVLRNSSMNITTYFSTTNREALLTLTDSDWSPENINEYLENPSVQLPINGYSASLSRGPYLEGVMERIRDFYFENATTNFELTDTYVILSTDLDFHYDVESWLKAHVAVSMKDTFYQQFSVDSLLNTLKVSTFPGAAHGDELCYIFYCRNSLNTYRYILDNQTDKNSAISLNTIRYLTELISNFVSFGTPTVKGSPIRGFRPVESNTLNFLDIRNDGLFLGVSRNGNRINFIDQMREEAIEIIAAHGDTPQETLIQMRCNRMQNDNR